MTEASDVTPEAEQTSQVSSPVEEQTTTTADESSDSSAASRLEEEGDIAADYVEDCWT